MNVRIRRYAEATNYAKVLTGVYNGIPKGENGMIIKYQNPAQPIKYMGGYDKRGNIVLPVNNENGMYPVFTQTKVGPIKKMSVLDELARMFEAKGWTRINDSSYKNSKITVGDITTENVGMLNGKPVIFDPEAAYNEDIIKVSNAKFKNK